MDCLTLPTEWCPPSPQLPGPRQEQQLRVSTSNNSRNVQHIGNFRRGSNILWTCTGKILAVGMGNTNYFLLVCLWLWGDEVSLGSPRKPDICAALASAFHPGWAPRAHFVLKPHSVLGFVTLKAFLPGPCTSPGALTKLSDIFRGVKISEQNEVRLTSRLFSCLCHHSSVF